MGVNVNALGTKDEAVLVTGASQGIGLALACLFSALRTPVVVTARDEKRLRVVRDALRARGGIVEAVACSASDEAGMQRAFHLAQGNGQLAAVINNAGVLEPVGPIRQMDCDRFSRHLDTNVAGVLVGTKLALSAKNRASTLRIVNVSSGAAVSATQGWGAYCASKAAVNMLTQVAALESAGDSTISVLALAPGIVETAMQEQLRAMHEDQFPDVSKFVRYSEMGELSHPVDAAFAIYWTAFESPMEWSGRFLDIRSPELASFVRAYKKGARPVIVRAVEYAKMWFGALA